ncbi:hypothetical protein LTR09_004872 [Extremus antarcticus]|uniref:NTF2-like domain-containing protein n=1 Tax=Extremus antarcticus TaxID=702011 RepID=A0AAJ0DQ29_9PEZI|nr:hypothetical protein LTR09_004872 [Extremus antarcticus]
MRSFTLLTTALVVASNVFAAPSGAGQGYCLCEKEAMAVADNVQHFFSNYSDEFARKVFTKNIQDQTDSVQFLMNNGTTCPAPLGSTTFANRKNLIKAQGAMGSLPWENENVFWDCKNVFIRWISKQDPFPVQGIAIFRTAPNPNATPEIPYLIDHIFSEFNSGAWLVNLGFYQGVGFAPGCEGVVGPKGNQTL